MINKEIVKIKVDWIDDPQNPMRKEMGEEGLRDLANSIKTVGLIQPITVRKAGDRYEVISGHRRLRAHRLLERNFIDCIVVEADEIKGDAMKVHENLFREDVNPVDQAVFLSKYAESNNLTKAQIAVELNRSENWVRSRLDILEYPDYLIEYIREGKLSLAAAKHLFTIQDVNLRRDYCRIAALQGLNANRALFWAKQSENQMLPSNPAEAPEMPEGEIPEDHVFLARCELCGAQDNMMKFDSVFVHPECLKQYQEILNKTPQSVPEENNNNNKNEIS